jgi:hypothetical protein
LFSTWESSGRNPVEKAQYTSARPNRIRMGDDCQTTKGINRFPGYELWGLGDNFCTKFDFNFERIAEIFKISNTIEMGVY